MLTNAVAGEADNNGNRQHLRGKRAVFLNA